MNHRILTDIRVNYCALKLIEMNRLKRETSLEDVNKGIIDYVDSPRYSSTENINLSFIG